MSSVPPVLNIDNLSVDNLTQNIIVTLTPFLYVIISLVAVICLLLIYICIMTTLTFKRAGRQPR